MLATKEGMLSSLNIRLDWSQCSLTLESKDFLMRPHGPMKNTDNEALKRYCVCACMRRVETLIPHVHGHARQFLQHIQLVNLQFYYSFYNYLVTLPCDVYVQQPACITYVTGNPLDILFRIM